MSNAEAEGGWLLEIFFPRPYDGIEKTVSADGLVIAIPFGTEQSAERAYREANIRVRPRYQVIRGEVLRGEAEQ